MKHTAYVFMFLGLAALMGGCAKPQSDSDAVRAGINQHLSGLKTINLSAMDMEVLNISIQGNQAQAQVEFRPKTGAPAGAGMQVSYSLAKQNGVWVVQTTQPMGGSIQHPGPGDNPHMTPGMTTPGMPNSSSRRRPLRHAKQFELPHFALLWLFLFQLPPQLPRPRPPRQHASEHTSVIADSKNLKS